jgi:hypothetical protein
MYICMHLSSRTSGHLSQSLFVSVLFESGRLSVRLGVVCSCFFSWELGYCASRIVTKTPFPTAVPSKKGASRLSTFVRTQGDDSERSSKEGRDAARFLRLVLW